MSEDTGGIGRVRSILEDPAIKKAFRDATKIPVQDVPGVPDDLAEIFLLDEMPDNLSEASPEIQLIISGIITVIGTIRDHKEYEFIKIQRRRKTERALIRNSLMNPPDGTSKLAKTTEAAVDAYIESQKHIKDLNDAYDLAYHEHKLLCTAHDCLKNYNINLNEYLKKEGDDEYAERRRRARQSRIRETEEHKAAKKKLKKKLKKRIEEQKKLRREINERIADPDLDD